jgi:hypothetical protein
VRRLCIARGIDRPVLDGVISRAKRQRRRLAIVRVLRPVFTIVEAVFDPLDRAQPVGGAEGDRHRTRVGLATLATSRGSLRDPQIRAGGSLINREDDLLRQIWGVLSFVPDVNRRDVYAFIGDLRTIFDARFDDIIRRCALDGEFEDLPIMVCGPIHRRRQLDVLNR